MMSIATLDVARILPRYRHSQKRLLLIDFEGTTWQRDIRTIARNAGSLPGRKAEFEPPEETLRLLNRLADEGLGDKDCSLVVKYVTPGRTQEEI